MKETMRKTGGGENREANILVILICGALLFTIGCPSPSQAAGNVPAPSARPGDQLRTADQTVALVNDQPIKLSELERHISTTRLSRAEALEDLIDLKLLRTATVANGLNTPKEPWSEEARSGIEFALARELALDVPSLRITLVVDHAWLKDADDMKGRAAGRALMERLRSLVEAGATIPKAYVQLRVKGTPWHIGDHEEYEYEIIPNDAHDLPPDTLSPIIPGDGGLHLFKIYQRKQEFPPRDAIRIPLLARLRLDATIERFDAPSQ